MAPTLSLVHRHLAWHHPHHGCSLHHPPARLPLHTRAIASHDTTAPAADGSTTGQPSGGDGQQLLEPGMTWPQRSQGCGTVSTADEGKRLTICGWVDRYRNLGGIVFLDIRDHTGIVQVV